MASSTGSSSKNRSDSTKVNEPTRNLYSYFPAICTWKRKQEKYKAAPSLYSQNIKLYEQQRKIKLHSNFSE